MDVDLDRLIDGGALKPEVIAEAVEQLADLRTAKREVESQIDRLQGAIAAHAKEAGLKELEGPSHKVKVAWSETTSLPASSSPDRKSLEEVVRRAGIWEQVSSLNAARIRKALKDGDVEGADHDELERLLVTKETSRVTISKLKK